MMKLVPSNETEHLNGKRIFHDFTCVREVFGTINLILQQKESFCNIFLIVAKQFLPEDTATHTIDCDRLFDRCLQYGDVAVSTMGQSKAYRSCTIMDCYPRDKVIHVNSSYIVPFLKSAYQVRVMFVFLLISLLHEICYLMTYHFNDLSGNGHGDKYSTPERIGAYTYPNNSKRPDCGSALEFSLFGGIPMLYNQEYERLCIYRIIDTNIPAIEENIIRVPIPESFINDAYFAIQAWYQHYSSWSTSILQFCLPTPAFPLDKLQAMHLRNLDESTALPASIGRDAINLESEHFSKMKCILKDSDLIVGYVPSAPELSPDLPSPVPGGKV